MKTKSLLLILPLTFASLVSCGNAAPSDSGGPSKTITLFRSDSKLIGTPKMNPESPGQFLPMEDTNIMTSSLPTYHHKNKGDVPYVEVSDLARAFNEAIPVLVNPGFIAEVKDDGYHLYTENRKGEFIINDENDTIKLKNGQAFVTPVLVDNNSIPGDYTNYRGRAIQNSEKTKIYKDATTPAPEYDVFDFGKYNLDIVKEDNKYYVPFEAFTKVFFRDISLDLAFNGKDYYTNQSNTSFLASWVYSSKGSFQGLSDVYYPSKSKGELEAYRFEQSSQAKKEGTGETVTYTRFLVLNNGGSGRCTYVEGTELDPTKAIDGDTESGYSYVWRQENNVLKINVFGGEGILGTYQVNLDETRFLSGTISQELSNYNYDVLRLIFDTSYGLRDIKGYTDAREFFKSAQVDSGLKSRNVDEYNTALSKLVGYIDDGHSAYKQMSQHSSPTEVVKADEYKKASFGPRDKKLTTDYQKYMQAKIATTKAKYPDELNPNDTNYYQGIRFSSNKETAVIQFNGFANNKAEISNMKDLFPNGDEGLTLEDFIRMTRSAFITSTPDGFTTAFKAIDFVNKTEKVVKNVVIDMTTNGGGEIATMPYIAAFFTDDPNYTIKDVTNGVTREYHYKVDINGDGVFGGVGDTYKGQFNFYFLTSSFSFSCGNCLPGMAKDAGAMIIGEKSGGGTSPVGFYFDALGTEFNLSNHYNMQYKVNGSFTHNDGGINLDYSYDYSEGNWYYPEDIQTFIHSLRN